MVVNSMLMVPASAWLVCASVLPACARPSASCRLTNVAGMPDVVLNATISLQGRNEQAGK